MNENIDLTKILKDCTEGFELYSSVHGEVKFVKCVGSHIVIVKKEGEYYYFTQKGVFTFQGILFKGECVLFPSKDQRDWSKFTASWHKKDKFDPKTLQPFNKVLVRNSRTGKWRCEHFSYFKEGDFYPYMASTSYAFCVPYNDDTKHLVGTDYKAPEYYRY